MGNIAIKVKKKTWIRRSLPFLLLVVPEESGSAPDAVDFLEY